MSVAPVGQMSHFRRAMAQVRPTVPSAARHRQLDVETVETLDALTAMRPAWDELYRRDPKAHIFLSSQWVSSFVEQSGAPWRIHVVKSGGDCVCLFPVRYDLGWDCDIGAFQSSISRLAPGGAGPSPAFLCDPLYQASALARLSRYLGDAPWADLALGQGTTSDRLGPFVEAFDPGRFRADIDDGQAEDGKPHPLSAPWLELPDTFEAYTRSALSDKGKALAALVERGAGQNSDGIRITETDATTFERDLDLLRMLGPRAGTDGLAVPDGDAREAAVRAAFGLNVLFMLVLWSGDRPVAVLAHIQDARRRRVQVIAAGEDPSGGLRGGKVLLNLYAIRRAIRQRFAFYQFGSGDQAPATALGASQNATQKCQVSRRSDAGADDLLDMIGMAEALRQTIRLLDCGRADDATKACKQILAACD